MDLKMSDVCCHGSSHGLIFPGGDVSYPPYDPTGEESGLPEVASNGTLARSVTISREWDDDLYDTGAADRAPSTSTKVVSLSSKMIAWGDDDPYSTQQAEASVKSVADWDDSQYEIRQMAPAVLQGPFRQGNYDSIDAPVAKKLTSYDRIDAPSNRASVYDSIDADNPAQYDLLDQNTHPQIFDSLQSEAYVSNPNQEVEENPVYKTRGGIPYASTAEVQYDMGRANPLLTSSAHAGAVHTIDNHPSTFGSTMVL